MQRSRARLVERPDGSLLLEETKPAYDATFVNEFVPEAGGGSHVTVTAEIRLKDWRCLASPFVAPLIRRRLRALALDPLRRSAELDAPAALR